MLALARGGAPEGEWLVAGRQTAGRGRLGRTWVSERGNLFASTLVRLQPGDPFAPSLALVAGLAVHDMLAALIASHRRVSLKWPNDVLLDGAKVAGILLEREAGAIVVGLGVNIMHAPSLERLVTALFGPGEAGEPPLDLVTFRLAPAFAERLAGWRGADGLDRIRAEWIAASHPLGTPLTVTGSDGVALGGRFDGLDANGALRLRLADGSARVIHAGDVALLQDP
jgi:BirA family transcriptional regulator, biotin operon repressor / biotin---[acetyl-CoA-carboxylase] ligase